MAAIFSRLQCVNKCKMLKNTPQNVRQSVHLTPVLEWVLSYNLKDKVTNECIFNTCRIFTPLGLKELMKCCPKRFDQSVRI